MQTYLECYVSDRSRFVCLSHCLKHFQWMMHRSWFHPGLSKWPKQNKKKNHIYTFFQTNNNKKEASVILHTIGLFDKTDAICTCVKIISLLYMLISNICPWKGFYENIRLNRNWTKKATNTKYNETHVKNKNDRVIVSELFFICWLSWCEFIHHIWWAQRVEGIQSDL